MVGITWTDRAKLSLKNHLIYSETYFGPKAANKLAKLTQKKVDQLQKYPLTGFPEPILSNRKENFRSCVIQKPIKMVYHYVEESDTLYIDNFWDMRRNPDALKGDI